MNKIVELSLFAVCFSVSVASAGSSQSLKCPGPRDGDEAWAEFSSQRGIQYSPEEWGGIWNYLDGVDDGSEEIASIKNNILDRLVERDPVPSDLGAKLLRLYRERAVNVRMRDYTLQHFVPYIQNMARLGKLKTDNDVQMMLAEIQGAFGGCQGKMGGT